MFLNNESGQTGVINYIRNKPYVPDIINLNLIETGSAAALLKLCTFI